MDYSTGSFGFQIDDGRFSNINSLYMFGNQGQNMAPKASSMMGTQFQYMYDPGRVYPSMMQYRMPTQSTYDYGILDLFKKNVIGTPLQIGMSRSDYRAGAIDFSSTATAAYGFDAANLAVSTIGGAAISRAAGPIMGIAGGLAISAGIDFARDKNLQNYRRTMAVSSMTSNVFSGDRLGLSGKDNKALKEYVEDIAADDVLLDSQDLMNINRFAKKSGMFRQASNLGEFKTAIKNFKEMVKGLADFTNSSDLQGLISDMSGLMNAGFTKAGASSFTKGMYISRQFAGISEEKAREFTNTSILIGKQNGIDPRLLATDTADNITRMKMMQQSGYLNPSLEKSATVYNAAAMGLSIKTRDYAMHAIGINTDMMKMYAATKAQREGGNAQDILSNLESMSPEKMREAIYSYDGGDAYRFALTSKEDRKNYLSTLRGVGTLVTKNDDIATSILDVSKKIGTRDARTIAMYLKDKQGLTSEEYSMLYASAEKIMTEGIDAYNAPIKLRDRVSARREASDNIGRYEERNSIYGRTKRFASSLYTGLVQSMGGAGRASDVIDKTQDIYFGGDGKRKYGSTYLKGAGMDKNILAALTEEVDVEKIVGPIKDTVEKQYTSKSEMMFGMRPGSSKGVLGSLKMLWNRATNITDIHDRLESDNIIDGYRNITRIGESYDRSKVRDLWTDVDSSKRSLMYKRNIDRKLGVTSDDISSMSNENKYIMLSAGSRLAYSNNKSAVAGEEIVKMILEGKTANDFIKKYREQNRDDTVDEVFTFSESDAKKSFSDARKMIAAERKKLIGYKNKNEYTSKYISDIKSSVISNIKSLAMDSSVDIEDKVRAISSIDGVSILSERELRDLANTSGNEDEKYMYSSLIKANTDRYVTYSDSLSQGDKYAGVNLMRSLDKAGLSSSAKTDILKSIVGGDRDDVSELINKMRKSGKISSSQFNAIASSVLEISSIDDDLNGMSPEERKKQAINYAYNVKKETAKKMIDSISLKYGVGENISKQLLGIASNGNMSIEEREAEIANIQKHAVISKEDAVSIAKLKSSNISDDEKRRKLEDILSNKSIGKEDSSKLIDAVTNSGVSAEEFAKMVIKDRDKSIYGKNITMDGLMSTIGDSKLFSGDAKSAKDIYRASGGDESKILSKMSGDISVIREKMEKAID